MTRPFLVFLMLAVLGAVMVPAAGARTAPAPQQTAPGVSAAEARAAIEVLRDPRRRAQMLRALEAIAKEDTARTPTAAVGGKAAASAAKSPAAPATQPPANAKPAAPAAVKLTPNGLGAAVVLGASGVLNHIGHTLATTFQTVQSLPLLWGWLVVLATNPFAQGLVVRAAWRLAVAVAVGLAVEYLMRRLLRGPIARLESRAPDGQAPPPIGPESGEAAAEAGETEAPPHPRFAAAMLLHRLPLVLARFALDLLPVLGFLVAGHIVAATPLGGSEQSRLIVFAMVDAYAVSQALIALARMVLSPSGYRLRLLHVSDDVARWATVWIRRLISVSVFGYAIAEVGLLLGMSDLAFAGLIKVVMLINHVFVAIMVIEKRRTVRRWLRAPEGARDPLSRLRNAVAPVWHWIALFFLFATWLVWAVEVRHGYSVVLRFFFILVLVTIVARLVLIVLLGSLERAARLSPEMAERLPELEARLAVYRPILQTVARGFVYLTATVVLLQLVGISLLSWLFGPGLGRQLATGIGGVLLTLLVALVIWEGTQIALQRHLAKLGRAQQTARSARLRTLVPLLRAALFVVIGTVAGLTVLSEIGIDIGPLLAGAGIVGVAIGFGSQKLVQDLITGIFLLAENAMQVGEVVSVGGLAGVVEDLSVRTIRLRSEDGSVHVIPFSSVTTVTNMTRDYSRAVFNVGVAYKENYDDVVEVLRALAREMRAEPAWASLIQEDLEVWGLDQFGDSAVVIKCRLRCTPFGRWSVMREFNRRMKQRFDELGIEIPFPHRKLVIDQTIQLDSDQRNATP